MKLSNQGWLLCYPLESFSTQKSIEKMILVIEKDGKFPSKTKIKNMLSKTIRLLDNKATITNEHYIAYLKLIDDVYSSNGWA